MFLTPDAVAAIAFHPAFHDDRDTPSCGIEQNENIKAELEGVKQYF